MNINESFLNLDLSLTDPSQTAIKYNDAKIKVFENLRNWELTRRQTFNSIKGLSDNLLKVLQAMNQSSLERLERLSIFFKQFRVPFKSTFTGFTNFSEFKFKRTKKQANNKRTTIENNELFDLMINFKEELEELEEKKKALERQASEVIAEKILKEAHLPLEEIKNRTIEQINVQKDKVEKFEPIVLREYDSLWDLFIRGVNRQNLNNKKFDDDAASRSTFEPLATFLWIAKQQMENLKSYCCMVVSLFETSKKLEAERIKSIKHAIDNFTIAISEVFGDGSKCFSISKYLGQNLDIDQICDFQYDLPALLLSSEIDLINKKCGKTEISSSVLLAFFNSFEFENVVQIINSMTVEKFKGRLLENDGQLLPVTLYLTVEHTFAVYKQSAQALFEALIFIETIELLPTENEDIFLLKFLEKGKVWNSTKSLKLQLGKKVALEIQNYKEKTQAIWNLNNTKSERGSSSENFVKKTKNTSIDDIELD